MHLTAYTLLLLPVLAGSTQAGQAATTNCGESDWSCILEDMASQTFFDCTGEAQDCFPEFLEIYTAGLGAASQTTDAAARIDIVSRALAVLPLIRTKTTPAGEILFSAVRYDACKTLGNEVCMTESANLIRMGISVPGNLDDTIGLKDTFLPTFDIHYPIDLQAVIEEVSSLELQE